MAIDFVPVVFGRGKPYFGTLADGHLMLDDPDTVSQGDGVLHVRYPVPILDTGAQPIVPSARSFQQRRRVLCSAWLRIAVVA